MCLEGVDSTFGRVDLVDIRRHELVVILPLLRYYTAVILDVLVVEYLEFHLVATLLEVEHDDLVGCNSMEVLIGLEGLD